MIYLEIELVVSDFDSSSPPDLVEIEVRRNSDEEVPVAMITGPSDGSPGEILILDGRESEDPDGGDLTYRWSQSEGPEAELDDPTASFIPVVVPDVADGTVLEFLLVVSDDFANSAPALHVINVLNPTLEPDAGSELGVDSGIDPTTDGNLFQFDTRGYAETTTETDPVSDCACSGSVSTKMTWKHAALGLLMLFGITRKKKGPHP